MSRSGEKARFRVRDATLRLARQASHDELLFSVAQPRVIVVDVEHHEEEDDHGRRLILTTHVVARNPQTWSRRKNGSNTEKITVSSADSVPNRHFGENKDVFSKLTSALFMSKRSLKS